MYIFLKALLGGPARSVARVSGLKSAAKAKYEVNSLVRNFFDDLVAQLQALGTTAANYALAALLNTFGPLFGKRALGLDFSSITDILSQQINNIYTSIVQVGSQLAGVNII